MKRLFPILVIVLLAAASSFGQGVPEVDLYNHTFTYEDGTGVGLRVFHTRRLWGNVRIVTDPYEREDLRIRFVNYGEPHSLDVSIVDKPVKEEQWHWVTRKGEEDFTIRITDGIDFDVSVLVVWGYDPKTKKFAKYIKP